MKIRPIIGSAITMFLLATSSPSGNAALTPGSLCEAANKAQGNSLGWSQAGIVNNSPTNSFFVVCGANAAFFFLADVFVDAIFPGSGSMQCIYRSVNIDDGSFTAVTMTINAGIDGTGHGNPDANHGTHSVFATTNAPPPVAGAGQINVVCALDPGEGVAGIETVIDETVFDAI